MRTLTKEIQEILTPKEAYNILAEGNIRFMQNLKAQRNLQDQVFETSQGQFPFAVIHSCIDSRVPVELVFDQGIGDIFSSRVAGNIINEDVLGSMEYACKVAGSKIVVVMGHTKCGAVTSACQHIQLGNITPLLQKITPVVKSFKESGNITDEEVIEQVTVANVEQALSQIREKSTVLKEMEDSGQIDIVGAIYNVGTGAVTFFD